MAVPNETNKEEGILIMARTEQTFNTKIRLWVCDSIKIFD
jgi:hypothetical protein